MSGLARDGTAEAVSRDQILRRERGQGNINFPCSADQEQDWQPYPVDPYSAISDDYTLIHTYMHAVPYYNVPGTLHYITARYIPQLYRTNSLCRRPVSLSFERQWRWRPLPSNDAGITRNESPSSRYLIQYYAQTIFPCIERSMASQGCLREGGAEEPFVHNFDSTLYT